MRLSYPTLPRVLLTGACAGLLSALALGRRGRQDAGSALVPLNAPSHWLYGAKALHQPRPSWRHTATGLLIHQASSMMWAALFDRVLGSTPTPSTASLARKAALVTGVAAFVDFKAVPERLTPGFEHGLSRKSLVLTYGAFAGGLLLGAMLWRGAQEKPTDVLAQA